jgi:hypothetical protein
VPVTGPGKMIFLAGVGAEDENGAAGTIPYKGDFAGQCKYAYDKIKRLLDKHGATLGDWQRWSAISPTCVTSPISATSRRSETTHCLIASRLASLAQPMSGIDHLVCAQPALRGTRHFASGSQFLSDTVFIRIGSMCWPISFSYA